MNKPVTVTFGDGKERVLRYSLGAAKRLKKTFGASLFNGFRDIDEDKLPILIYEGLRGGDPSLTIDQVEEMIDMQALPEVLKAIMAAFGYDNSPKNDTPAAAPQTENQPENSTLKTSGQLDATISG